VIRAGLLVLALATVGLPLHAAPVTLQSNSFFNSDGVRLHLLEAGQVKPGQPVVIFVPGWSIPASIWAKQLEALAATHKVIAFDPRGQGDSEIPRNGYTTEQRAQDLHEFVALFESVVLVTWSLGSLEALQAMHDYGDANLRALVIVDSSVGEQSVPVMLQDPPPPDPPRPPGPQLSFTQELRMDRVKALDDFMHDIFKTPQPAETLLAYRESALRMPLEASLSIFPGSRIPREQWRRTVMAFAKPLLYVVTPQFAGQAVSLKEHRPGTRIEVFERAGHALFVDEPERFSALLADFLRSNGLF